MRHAVDRVDVVVADGSVRVDDDGAGVARADRERVFVAFQRLGDSPSGQGVGLGLAVARGLTEAMGGSVTADSEIGRGTTFTVRLPD